MAIQLRRGAYADFDPTKMVPAEVGIVTSGDPNTDDGKAAYVAFSAGNAKRLATVEDIATDLQEATDDAVEQATARAEAAAESVESSAAQIATNTADISDLKADLILQMDEIPNTVQSYTFADGAVSQIVHNRSDVAIRTDTFAYGEDTITEVRTSSTGILTIVTNLTTLETTVTYAAA